MEAPPSPLSSRPKRPWISYFALLATTTCAALRKESRMQIIKATGLDRKSGGAQWRDLRFSGPFLGMFFDRGVMNLWPTQGDEKRILFSNDCRWRHRPPLCHLDRSVPGFPTSHCRQRPRVRFSLRKPHDDDQRHGSQQEIRGSVVDLQSLRTFRTQWNPSEMLRSDVQ
jgi:hypothetical protein